MLNFEPVPPAPSVVFAATLRALFLAAIVSVREALYRVVGAEEPLVTRRTEPAAANDQRGNAMLSRPVRGLPKCQNSYYFRLTRVTNTAGRNYRSYLSGPDVGLRLTCRRITCRVTWCLPCLCSFWFQG